MKKRAYNRFASLAGLALCAIVSINIGFSLENTNGEKALSSSSAEPGIELTIEFHERRIYYIDSNIIVQFQVVNRSTEPFLFNTSFDKYFTFDFEIKNFSGRAVAHSRAYEVARTQFQPVKIDEITLKQNEVYGVRINLTEWFDLREPT